ncbi:MAG: serine protease [Azoarcus sp.]|nr:serine protease [Azoarcus sp.]
MQFTHADGNEGDKDAAAIPAAKELSATAEQIFGKAQPRLLQIRTLLKSAQKQSSIGSGFLVGEDGRAITNYHVVSQFALEPDLYQIEYTVADGARGQLKLLAIDVANDLAVVQLEAPPGKRFGAFEFDPVAVRGAMVKGERLFSMGNPLDLGFTIVEGTYNGMVDKSYQKHVHFTGAINPGMSGGPVVTVDNRIAGINVARNIGNDLVSFLVPANAAVRLLERADSGDELDAPSVRKEIGAQMARWQKDFFAALRTQGFHEAQLGPYRVAESNADWFNCWARTNRDERNKALENSSRCDTRTHLFLADDMAAGEVEISHTYLKSVDLGPIQFAQRLTRAARPYLPGGDNNRYTPFRCYEDFLAPNLESPSRPELRVAWCARAYKDFAELYDVSFVSVTQDDDREALVSSAMLTGVHFENALSFTQDFLAALKVQRDLD